LIVSNGTTATQIVSKPIVKPIDPATTEPSVNFIQPEKKSSIPESIPAETAGADSVQSPQLRETVTGSVSNTAPEPNQVANGGSPRVSYLGARSMSKVVQKPEPSSQTEAALMASSEADRFVSTAELQEVWKKYADTVKKEGKLQLYTTLTMSDPVMDPNGFEILFTLHNPSQQELLIEEGPGLMDHLRLQLNHFRLVLKTKLDPISNDPEAAFTNKEKYLKMAEKNPELDAFRRQLGLELEL